MGKASRETLPASLDDFGTLLGGLSMSAMSGASTYALGQVAVTQFEERGSISGADMSKVKSQYISAFEKGKAVVADLEKRRGSTPQDPVERLQKLKSLLDAGLIEQEEYDEQRARVLADI